MKAGPEFPSQWKATRGLTLDLLRSLEPSDLKFSPGPHVGALWKHFRHLGRVQENYLHAMESGRIAFGLEGASYQGGASGKQLLEYLARLDLDLSEKLKSLDTFRQSIDWFGESVSIANHLARLSDHEVLHQGMLVVYMRLLDRRFPRSWKVWGF